MRLFLIRTGESERGPITQQQLRTLAESGQLEPEALVRTTDRDEWVRADEVRGLNLVAPVRNASPATTHTTPSERKPATRRRYVRTAAFILRVPLFLVFIASAFCTIAAFLGEQLLAQRQFLFVSGISGLISTGLGLLICRMAEVVADISETLDREKSEPRS